MNKRTKEKRLNDNCHLVDEDDLIGINCTFKDIRHELKEIRNELKHNRESNETIAKANDIRLNSMEKSNDIRYYTLLAVISFFGILLSILKVLFNG